MKRSYFVSPRSLGDATFIASADPIERPTRRAPIATTAVFAFVVALIVAATFSGAV
jgi:hypothetical protein